jgi:hypothetical protein
MLHNSTSGLETGFRAGFRPDSNRECLEIGLQAGRRPTAGWRVDFEFFPDQNLVEMRPGRPISGPEALLRNIGEIPAKD